MRPSNIFLSLGCLCLVGALPVKRSNPLPVLVERQSYSAGETCANQPGQSQPECYTKTDSGQSSDVELQQIGDKVSDVPNSSTYPKSFQISGLGQYNGTGTHTISSIPGLCQASSSGGGTSYASTSSNGMPTCEQVSGNGKFTIPFSGISITGNINTDAKDLIDKYAGMGLGLIVSKYGDTGTGNEGTSGETY